MSRTTLDVICVNCSYVNEIVITHDDEAVPTPTPTPEPEDPVCLIASFTGDPAGWYHGSQSGGTLEFIDGAAKGTMPAGDDKVYNWFGAKFPELGLREAYMHFKAKLVSKPPHGFKFTKVFGINDDGYANSTFGLVYSNGDMLSTSFGDGSTTGNDTQQTIKFTGEGHALGRNKNIALILTPQMAPFDEWDDDYHDVKLMARFNSGDGPENEVPDGAYYVEIDGRVFLDVENVFNRHWSNKPIDKIEFFGYVGDNSPGVEVWYKEIFISTGGFL